MVLQVLRGTGAFPRLPGDIGWITDRRKPSTMGPGSGHRRHWARWNDSAGALAQPGGRRQSRRRQVARDRHGIHTAGTRVLSI